MYFCLFLSLSHLPILSLLHFISSLIFLFYIFSLCPFPSLFFPLTHLSLLLPLILSLSQSTPLCLVSLYSLLPSLFSLLSLFSPFSHFFLPSLSSPFFSILSTFSVSHSVGSLPSVSPLHFSPLSHSSPFSSPFSTSLPFSSLHAIFLYPLPSVYLNSFSLLSLLSFLPSLTSPFLFSIPFTLHSLSTHSFSLHSLLCLSTSFSLLSLSPLPIFSLLIPLFCLSPVHSFYPLPSLFSLSLIHPFSHL